MSDSRILKTLVCEHERYSELMHQIAHEPYVGEYGRTLGDDVLSCCLAENPTPDCNTPLKTAADRLFNPHPHQTHPNLAPNLLNLAWAPLVKPQTAGTVISGKIAAALGVGTLIYFGIGLLVASSPTPTDEDFFHTRRETQIPPWIPSVGFLPSLLDDDNLPAITAESSGNNSFPPLDILTPQATRPPSGPLFVVSTGSGIHFSPEEDDDDDKNQLKRFAEELRRTRNNDIRRKIAAATEHLRPIQRAVLLTKLAICIIQLFAEQEDSLPGDDISEDNHLLTDMEQILFQIIWLLKHTHAQGTEKQLNHDFASSLDTFIHTEQGRRTTVMSEISAGAIDTSDAHGDLTELFGKVRTTVRNRNIAVTRYQRELACKFVEYLLRGEPRLEWDQKSKTCKLFYPQALRAHTKKPASIFHNSPFPPDPSDPIVAAYLQVLGWKLKLVEEREYVWSF